MDGSKCDVHSTRKKRLVGCDYLWKWSSGGGCGVESCANDAASPSIDDRCSFVAVTIDAVVLVVVGCTSMM